MGLAAVAVVLILLVNGILQARRLPDPVGVSEAPVSPELLAVGADLYKTTCAVCHGPQGEGFATAGVPAPPLDGSAHAWHHPDEQIVGWIRNGGIQMPAVGAAWSDDQIRAVMAHVKQWWEPWQREAQPGEVGETIEGRS